MHYLLEHSAAIATILAFGAAVPTVYFGLMQYREDIHKSQVETTLAYITRYRTDPIDHDRMIVNTKLVTPEAVSIYSGDHKNYKQRVHDFDAKYNLDSPLIRLIGFYDEMYVCVERKVCDLSTAVVLIGHDIRSDYAWAGSEIDFLRDESVSDIGFGCGFTSLAKESKYYWTHARVGQNIVLPELAKCPNLDAGE